MNKLIYIAILLTVLFQAGCKKKEKPVPLPPPATEEKVVVPAFNADSAYQFIRKQVDFGPRVPNTESHRNCARYLADNLRRYTPQVTEQKGKVRAYDGTVLNFTNIIGSFNPEAKARILLCAHWDSRPWADHDPDPALREKPIDGANDGASGVGVLMEIARLMSTRPPTVGVDILLLDAEDYGPPEDSQVQSDNNYWGLGSQYWSNNPHIPGYTARFGILLDMVGAANARFPMEAFSNYYAPDILRKVWNKALQLGYKDYFPNEDGGMINDDHYFINTIRRIPTIDIIHLDPGSANGSFFDYWHTTGDTLDKIDPYILEVVGKTLMQVVYAEK
ncbi:MAG: M28 family peptidase [Bacteroidales bacterium]|nr:M28 family peptidase [Lentimicrobiaceae bacterium]MDD5695559.1 M28 family peptidase [Bacteroidales bacterium]